MRISEIVMKVLNKLISEEDLKRLSEMNKDEDGEQKEIPIPKSIPREIENPVIGDLYGDDESSENDDYLVLGSYTPMRSPGVITFYIDNITNYTGSLIRKIVKAGNIFNLDLLVNITSYVVENTLLHESFHYYCDYKRQITGSKFDRDKEEALAVAHSYLNIDNSKYSRIRSSSMMTDYHQFEREFNNKYNIRMFKDISRHKYLEAFKLHHFSTYTLAGYRDWKLYVGNNSYETDFFNYVKDAKLDSLLRNGVNVNDIHNETMIIGYKGVDIRIK